MKIKGLLDCPFCGGKARLKEERPFKFWSHGDSVFYTVECKRCKARSVSIDSETIAVKRWNRRPVESKINGTN